MAKFTYAALDSSGTKKEGIIESASEKSATGLLHDRGLIVVDLKPFQDRSLGAIISKVSNVSSKDLAIFTRQLATMIGAGLNLLEALNVIAYQSSQGQLKNVISDVSHDIQSGNTFSQALSRYPRVFSKVYISIVKAGEASGSLDKVLTKLAETLEKQDSFQKKVTGALIYPAIVLVAMVIVMIIVTVFIVPKITSVFTELGGDLPLPTQIVIFLSNLMLNYWYIPLGLVIITPFAYRYYANTPDGREFISSFLLKIPVLGTLIAQSTLTTFTRILSILIGSGVTILEALKISTDTVGNYQFRKALLEVSSAVEKGSSLSVPISRQKIFPPIVGQMMAVGEETGQTDEVLDKLSRYFETETEAAVKNITTAIEPIVIIMLGLMAGFLVLAVILPLYSVTTQIAK